MPDLSAPDYQLARIAIERGLGAIYLIAFIVAATQFPALCGERGLEPATRILRATRFLRTPSLFHFGYSDTRLRVVAVTGAALAAAILVGLPQQAPLPVTMLCWFGLWALYLSIVNVGGTFYGFGWETLLLEAGFLAIFLGNALVAPAWPIIPGFLGLGFRVGVGPGVGQLPRDEWLRDPQLRAGPALVRRGSRRLADPHHGPQLLPGAQPGEPLPGDERLVRSVPPGQHVWRVRIGQPAALRGDHRGDVRSDPDRCHRM